MTLMTAASALSSVSSTENSADGVIVSFALEKTEDSSKSSLKT
jgi:hypothetical protein